jgi:hypothetical protein
MTANVNFKETITTISGGITLVSEVEPIMDEQDFPIITLAISSKQNISASVVPSEAMKPSLYLRKKEEKLTELIINHFQSNICGRYVLLPEIMRC